MGSGLQDAWVVPDLAGPPSGGTLYNARLLRALAEQGLASRVLSLDQALAAPPVPAARHWIDSLYLGELPRLREHLGAAPLWVVLHYLPSLVASGPRWTPAALTPPERTALAVADGFLVTSAFMRRALHDALGTPRPTYLVEPGVDAGPVATAALAAPPRMIALGHLLPGKQVAELLDALADGIAESAGAWSLRVVGSLAVDPPYAQRCLRRVAEHAALRSRVTFSGQLAPDAARAELCASDLLVSASRMEAYGMALAEARAVGVPILALGGGHAASHVDAAAGGELCASLEALCERLLSLGLDHAELGRRKRAASHDRRARDWREAGADFMRQRREER